MVYRERNVTSFTGYNGPLVRDIRDSGRNRGNFRVTDCPRAASAPSCSTGRIMLSLCRATSRVITRASHRFPSPIPPQSRSVFFAVNANFDGQFFLSEIPKRVGLFSFWNICFASFSLFLTQSARRSVLPSCLPPSPLPAPPSAIRHTACNTHALSRAEGHQSLESTSKISLLLWKPQGTGTGTNRVAVSEAKPSGGGLIAPTGVITWGFRAAEAFF